MNLKSKIALAALALTAGATAFAQVAYNVGVVSEYRYRGIAQTAGDPALQGGVDYAHASGFYVGAWGSTITWIKDAGAEKGSFELDIYGGYKGAINKDLAYDVGYLRYEYVGNKYETVTGKNANTDELYGALTYGPYTAKYSYAFSSLFGAPGSKGSGYLDLSATFDLGGGYALVPHVGHQDIKGKANEGWSYTDYSLTLTKDFGGGVTGSLAAIGTSANDTLYTNPQGKKVADDTIVVGVKYSF